MSEFLQAAQDYLPDLFAAAVQYTIPLTLISFALGLVIATLVALLRLAQPPQNSLVDRLIIRGAQAIAFFMYGCSVQHR